MSAGLASAPPRQRRCVCVRDGQLLGSSAGKWKRPPTASTSLPLRVLSGRVTSWSLAGQSDVILPPRRRLGAVLTGVFVSPAEEAAAGVLFLAFVSFLDEPLCIRGEENTGDRSGPQGQRGRLGTQGH